MALLIKTDIDRGNAWAEALAASYPELKTYNWPYDGDPARFLEGGDLEAVPDNTVVERVTLCRPGVRTMWDALLSEGRRYFFFASSDWHSRGSLRLRRGENVPRVPRRDGNRSGRKA